MTTVNEAIAALRGRKHFSIKKRRELVAIILAGQTLTPGSAADRAAKALKNSKRYSVTWERRFLESISSITPTINPLRVVSLQNRAHTSLESRAGKLWQANRISHVIATDAFELVVCLNNWYMTASNTIVGTGNTLTIESMSIEDPSGVVVPVYFGGLRSVTLADGDTNIKSDPVLPSSFSRSVFARTDTYYIKSKINTPALVPFSPRLVADATGDQVAFYDTAVTTVSSTDVAGKYTATGTAFDNRISGFYPMLLGRPVVDGKSYIVIGDSIGEVVGDNTSNGLVGRGFIQRAMVEADGTLPMPCISICKSGSRSIMMASNNPAWTPYIAYARFAIDEYGTNDIQTGSLPNTKAGLQANWTQLNAGGIEKIIKTSMMTRTTSTDTWSTEVNQTPTGGWEPGGIATQLNTYILTQPDVDYVVPMVSIINTTSRVFITNGSPNYINFDNIHPNTTGAIILAAELRTVLAGVA